MKPLPRSAIVDLVMAEAPEGRGRADAWPSLGLTTVLAQNSVVSYMNKRTG